MIVSRSRTNSVRPASAGTVQATRLSSWTVEWMRSPAAVGVARVNCPSSSRMMKRPSARMKDAFGNRGGDDEYPVEDLGVAWLGF